MTYIVTTYSGGKIEQIMTLAELLKWIEKHSNSYQYFEVKSN